MVAGAHKHSAQFSAQLLAQFSAQLSPQFSHPRPIAPAQATVDCAAEHRDAGGPCAVVGVDVAAGEAWLDPSSPLHAPTVAALADARRRGLPITLHAGEEGGAENVLRCAREYGASRIGHGYQAAAPEAAAVMAELIAAGVHFEACPTSSWWTSGWRGPASERSHWPAHPLTRMVAAGASCGINSDDPAVFATSLGAEYSLAAERIGLTTEQMQQRVLDAADASFQSPAERRALKRVVRESFVRPAAA